MKKILIFTASTGEGHNQVAKSLELELDRLGYDVTKVDFVKQTRKIVNRLIEDGYLILATKFPKLYGHLYNFTNRDKITKSITRILALEEYKLGKKLIKKYEPNLIIGTHPFVVPIVDTIKRRGYYNCPVISIITDFEAHQVYISKHVDAYITGSYHTNESLISKGIDENKIHTFGIPINKIFFEQKEEIIDKNNGFKILMMGGSMGVKTMKKAFNSLLDAKNVFSISIVCGNNIEIYDELQKFAVEYDGNKNINIIGFSDNISELMEEADVIISKPGGLTVTEAIVKNLPMIIPYYIPGQEGDNKDFLAISNIAINVKNVEDLPSVIDDLIESPEKLEKMRDNMKLLSNNYSINKLIKLIDEILECENH